MRILLVQMNPTIGDLAGNTDKIVKGIQRGIAKSADIVVFPELCLTGYPPEDFLLRPNFLDSTELALKKVIEACKGIIVIVGTPRKNPAKTEKGLFNSAAIIQNQTLIGFQDKSLLPTYDVFDERRYFEPAEDIKVWELLEKRVAVTICEDIWQHSQRLKLTSYRRDPVKDLKKQNPELLINLSASPFSVSKKEDRLAVCTKAAQTLNCPLVLCNQVGGNDSLIFDGHSLYAGSQGELLAYAKGFEEDNLLIDISKKSEPIQIHANLTEDLYKALVLGLRDYFQKSGFEKTCLGLSGGIDSALVACIAADALGKENVLGVSMPSRFTAKDSISDALQLARNLGIQYQEIPIEKPFETYLDLLTPSFEGKPFDTTEENIQARIRGMILMAISNKLGYIVLSTGNKSELALGYATLYGDMCGGLGVINDVTKGQVYTLAKWLNRDREVIPWNTISKPPSAELRPNQKDSDSLPDYEIVDNVLQSYVEDYLSPEEIAEKFHYPLAIVQDLIKRIHRNEYKRRQSPPGLRISEKAFSVGRRFPIVQKFV